MNGSSAEGSVLPSPTIITSSSPVGKRLLDSLQTDLRSISNESKKKHPPLKEAAESGIVKLRSAATRHEDLRLALLSDSPEIMEPFFMACDTKVPKLVQISLTGIQRMITFEAVSAAGSINLINCLWNLLENGIEELKLLQTITLLISTNNVVQGDPLSKSLAICFRLHFTKNQTINNAASATVRNLVSVIYERVIRASALPCASGSSSSEPAIPVNVEELKQGSRFPPKSLKLPVSDAFLLFQDLIQLTNAEPPYWLCGLTEMTRTFGLELLELIFTSFPEIFFKYEEFSFLLKERVCPLVIRLFSANIKYKPPTVPVSMASSNGVSPTNQGSTPSLPPLLTSPDKPFYPISIRLLRIVSILIQKFYSLLITESEIFLSLLIRFLEPDKPVWQRAVALEVIHTLCTQPSLLRSFCLFYDMKPQNSKILRDMVTALGIFIQGHFLQVTTSNSSLLSSLIGGGGGSTSSSPASNVSTNGSNNSTSSNFSSNSSQNPTEGNNSAGGTAAFSFKSIWIPYLNQIKPGQPKCYYLNQLDKVDVPIVIDGYPLSTAFDCLHMIVRGIVRIIEGNTSSLDATPEQTTTNFAQKTRSKMEGIKNMDPETRGLHESLLLSSWSGLLASFSVLLETSTDEQVTSNILRMMEVLIGLYGVYNLSYPRNATVIALCRSSLPVGYSLPNLNFKIAALSDVPTPDSSTGSDPLGHPHHIIGEFSRTCTTIDSGVVTSSIHPPSGMQAILSVNAVLLQQQLHQTTNSYLNGSNNLDATDLRQQIVAVGTPLPSSRDGAASNHGPVMLTAKNLQCMKYVLHVAYNHGNVLDDSWLHVLLSLQHLVWILGLKPSTGGTLKASKPGSDATNANIVTTAVMSDLPVLSAMLSRLFSSSLDLDERGLIYLVLALIKLSSDSMSLAWNNRESSLFALAKILETGLVNIDRIFCVGVWAKLSEHLIEGCMHPHHAMRELAVEVLTSLVLAVISKQEKVSNGDIPTEKVSRTLVLGPLQELNNTPHLDIRQKQLEVCLQMIQSSGETLGEGWPQVLDIVGSIKESHSENLVRLSFQCLQLIISDFQANVPASCIFLLVNAAYRFGSQNQEMNVSLTAIGSIWNVADFLFQNQMQIREDLAKENALSSSRTLQMVEGTEGLPGFECLWMRLFDDLALLCTDSRPAIRKSASQTLFAALTTHTTILMDGSWSPILWSVLFPLLERVNNKTTAASDEKITDVPKSMGMTGLGVSGVSGSILLHHSRNTASKQWSETSVIILAGFCRIFHLKKDILSTSVKDFDLCWLKILHNLEIASMSKNTEVSISALKCFQDILAPSASPSRNNLGLGTGALDSWFRIGEESTKPPTEGCDYIPSQSFLTNYIQIFPFLFSHVRFSFSKEHFVKLSTIMQGVLSVPLDLSTQSFVFSIYSSSSFDQADLSSQVNIPLTPLQEAVFLVIDNFYTDILPSSMQMSTGATVSSAASTIATSSSSSSFRNSLPRSSTHPFSDQHHHHRLELLPSLFSLLLSFFSYSSRYPSYGSFIRKPPTSPVSKETYTHTISPVT